MLIPQISKLHYTASKSPIEKTEINLLSLSSRRMIGVFCAVSNTWSKQLLPEKFIFEE